MNAISDGDFRSGDVRSFGALRDRALSVLVVLGIAVRVGYAVLLARHGLPNAGSEAWQVAVHFAHGQGLAGAYKFGDAATAHVLPIPPMLAGSAYALFGVSSPLAETLLLFWSTGLVVAGCLLFNRAFAMLDTPRPLRLLAVAVLMLANPYLSQEVIEFRVWDGGLASALSAACLVKLLRIVRDERVGLRPLGVLVAANALLFFVNPLIGAAAYCCTALVMFTRLPPKRFMQVSAIALLALAALITPWTWRNERVMGKVIPLRSNAGLELAISMYPGAARPTNDPANRFADRLREIHPQDGRRGFDAMLKEGGEVPYFAHLGRDARGWIIAHPGDAVRVAIDHVGQILFPPAWLFDVGSTNHRASLMKSLVARCCNVAGLLGIALALARRRPHWIFPALLVIVPTLLTAPFQPVARYIYLIFPPLVFAGADLLAAVAARLSPAWARAAPGRQAA